MPTQVSVDGKTNLKLRTADEFMGWLVPGVPEYWILDPQTLVHRFYRREGELLVELAAGEGVIRSGVVPRFWVRREWLDPEHLPKVADALAGPTGRRRGVRILYRHQPSSSLGPAALLDG